MRLLASIAHPFPTPPSPCLPDGCWCPGSSSSSTCCRGALRCTAATPGTGTSARASPSSWHRCSPPPSQALLQRGAAGAAAGKRMGGRMRCVVGGGGGGMCTAHSQSWSSSGFAYEALLCGKVLECQCVACWHACWPTAAGCSSGSALPTWRSIASLRTRSSGFYCRRCSWRCRSAVQVLQIGWAATAAGEGPVLMGGAVALVNVPNKGGSTGQQPMGQGGLC